MRSSPNGLTDDEEAAEVEQGIFPLPMEGIAEDDDDWSFTPNLQAKFLFPGDNNDGHNNTEHQRPSTSESCARGDDKRTRTSTQSDAGDDDSNPSCNGEEEEALRQQQEGLFASLVVVISLNHVTNIVETLLRGNARPCLRMLHFREHLRYGKAANLSFEAGIVCDVNRIDNSLLQELLKFCQGVEINGAQDEPVICCVNHDSKLLHYRGRDGRSATRELCTYGDCAMLKDGTRSFCHTHKKVKNRRTDITDSTEDNNECNLVDFCRDHANKPFLHQLAHKLLVDLATPQQKVVVDLLRKDCEDAVGETSKGNIFINLDGIPKQVLELLCLNMAEYYADSEKYRIGSLLGIEQQSLEDEEKYKKMYLRSISIRRDFKRKPDGSLGSNIINEEGKVLSNIKNAPRKKSDREDAQTNHPSSDPRKCSMQTRIALTTPLPLREYQMRMTSDGVMRQSAEDAFKCISGIKDNAMRKSAFDAFREKVGKRNNEPLTVEDIAKVIQANVMKHRVLGRVACPALELLYQAFTQDEYKTLLKIVPTNELPRLVKGKYAGEPEVLGEFAVMIHNPGIFIEKCMSQLWGHMDLHLFAMSFDKSDCKVSVQMKKGTKFPYICIINNSFTSDPGSLIGNKSIEELNVELKAMKAKEKVQLEKEKKMMGEVILLKARVAELEGSLGVTGADVTVDTSSTDEEGKEVTDEPSAITPQNSHAVILTNKRIPKKSYAREQAAAAASSSVELHVTPGSHTSTVAEPVGTLLHSGGDGANTDLADGGVQIQNHSLVPSRNMFGGDSSLRDSIRGGGGHAPGRGGNLRPQYAPNSRGGGGRGGGHAPGRGGNLRPQYAPSSRGGGGRGGGHAPGRGGNLRPHDAPSSRGGGGRGGGHAPGRGGNRPPNAPIHGRGGGYAPIGGGRGNAPVRGQYRPPHSVPSRGEGGYHSVDHTSAPRGSGYGNGSSNNKSSLQEHGHGASYGSGARRRVGKIVKVFGHRGYGFINSDEILGSDGKQKDIFFTLERKIFDHIQDKDCLRGSLVSFVLEYENSGKTKATLLKFVEEPN